MNKTVKSKKEGGGRLRNLSPRLIHSLGGVGLEVSGATVLPFDGCPLSLRQVSWQFGLPLCAGWLPSSLSLSKSFLGCARAGF